MGYKLFKYSSHLGDELQDIADALYHRALTFRAGWKNPKARYNVAVFMVCIDDIAVGYFTSRSDPEENEHSEDAIVHELGRAGIKPVQIKGVFTEWPPCVRKRGEAPAVFAADDSGSSDAELDYTPHACSIMLGNILPEGTPVFHGTGPIVIPEKKAAGASK